MEETEQYAAVYGYYEDMGYEEEEYSQQLGSSSVQRINNLDYVSHSFPPPVVFRARDCHFI